MMHYPGQICKARSGPAQLCPKSLKEAQKHIGLLLIALSFLCFFVAFQAEIDF